MADRTPLAALRLRQRTLQHAVSCVGTVVVVMATGSTELTELTTPQFSARSHRDRFALWIEERAIAIPAERGYVPKLIAYTYTLDRSSGQEVLAWHLHANLPNSPHLHLGSGLGTFAIDVSHAHVPTGIVPVQEFIRFLIRDLGVRPSRPDWQAVLASLDRP